MPQSGEPVTLRRTLDTCQTILILAEVSLRGAAAPPNTRRSLRCLRSRHLRAYWTAEAAHRRSLRNGAEMDDTLSRLIPCIGFPLGIF